ncbi:uncharacterized protein LOC133843754 [Drosophila sulfurigaster albostrigata]|uniref:uncharacterized protein LOC133843754 n=1 Tax=Drosophila sulfurigaster albostrigata TaxID=89887 RepID=UPI002D21BA31|nr:uncharacterized protein LOC133843754 [Drosophila sulfurigaster albostrigata]
MKYTLIFTLLAAFACTCFAAPLDLNDLFSGLSPVEQQAPTQDVVKRQVVANPDSELKQISFQTLIGNLENSLFQSALSLHGASAPDSTVDEVQPGQDDSAEHSITKRADEVVTVLPATGDEPQERKILVQTTKKVPSEDGVPAHLIIDHVSVQPHNGLSVPLIPTFQVHHTKITSATIVEDANNDSSDGKQTKISITKTSITSTAPVESIETQSSSVVPEIATSSITTEQATSSSSESSSSESTSSSSTSSTTSEQPIVTKLKEKVAEVEAEPVILTARV